MKYVESYGKLYSVCQSIAIIGFWLDTEPRKISFIQAKCDCRRYMIFDADHIALVRSQYTVKLV